MNPSQVTFALVRVHSAAHFVKVLHHCCFAFDTESGRIREGLFNFGGDGVRGAEELLDFGILVVDATAHLGAYWTVGFMELCNLRKLRIRKMVFLP